jgi:uncharacterized membrane-anchored protein
MRYVIIGKKDDAQLLVVDTQLMTVSALDQASVLTPDLQSQLADGGTLVQGIDIAVAAGQRDEAASIWFYQNK